MNVTRLTARQILDSRGRPTVEATLATDRTAGTASVPSGTSTGSHEARELRDGDRRWGGHGVAKAVSHVNVELASALKGKPIDDQAAFDSWLRETDGTDDKSRLGANALLAVSLAAFKARASGKGSQPYQEAADLLGVPAPTGIPVPLCNVLNGGAHADNSLVIQEFMIVPHGLGSFSNALRALSEVSAALRSRLAGQGAGTGVGLEGGFAPDLPTHSEALDLLVGAIKDAGYEPGTHLSLALDVAASGLLKDGRYVFEGQALSAEQLVAQYASLLDRYPIVSIEDPLGEEDVAGWERAAARLRGDTQLVGDDLTVTDAGRIKDAAAKGLISAVIIKPNQIGTVSETLDAVRAARENGIKPILSHRSGETNDDVLADFAVGWEAPQIKAGGMSRGERVAKYNRLWQIEQALGGSAVYAGKGFGNE